MTADGAHTGAAPLVGVVVVTWNGRARVLACLGSLRASRLPGCRALVVDNGSSDGTEAAVREGFPEVELISNPVNAGFAAAANRGIRRWLHGGADLVLLLNDDARVAPDCLDALVAELRAHPEAGMAGPKILESRRPERIWSAGGEIALWKGRIVHRGIRDLDGGAWDEADTVDWLTGCVLLVNRACIEAIGLLDEEFFAYGEDVDWCLRARRRGFACRYVPAARAWHQISASTGGGLTPFKAYHRVRSGFVLFRRYAPWWQWTTMPAWVLAGILHQTAARVSDGPTGRRVVGALWRALADAALGRPPAHHDSQPHAGE